MAKDKRKIYGLGRKNQDFPIPTGTKFGTAASILRQIYYKWGIPIRGKTTDGEQWDESTNLVCYRQIQQDNGVLIERVDPRVLVEAAEDPRGDIDTQELKDIAQQTWTTLQDNNIDVEFAVYGVMIAGNRTSLTLKPRVSNSVNYTADIVDVGVIATQQEIDNLSIEIPDSNNWFFTIRNRDRLSWCRSRYKYGDKITHVLQFTMLYHFNVSKEEKEIGFERLKELVEQHNKCGYWPEIKDYTIHHFI